jgi:Transposase domain (DUF772)
VIGLLLLKHIFALSDEEVCERWVYDPYFQYFTGEQFTEPGDRAIFSAACPAVPSRIVDASLTFPIKNDISAMDEIIL